VERGVEPGSAQQPEDEPKSETINSKVCNTPSFLFFLVGPVYAARSKPKNQIQKAEDSLHVAGEGQLPHGPRRIFSGLRDIFAVVAVLCVALFFAICATIYGHSAVRRPFAFNHALIPDSAG